MHAEAHEWVARYATDEPVTVLDLGGRDINGSCRGLFPNADYVALDLYPGEGVDIVGDAASWIPDREYDIVLSTECFEHTTVWPQIIGTAYTALRPGGRLVATMAGPGRPAHSAIDGGWHLHPGEHYQNITPAELTEALSGWDGVVVDRRDFPADVRCSAVRPAL